MKMENKYYTPEIDEFHVGFEYEFDNTWGSYSKRVVTEENLMDRMIPIGSGNDRVPFNHKWRVKYLDQEDIESLGFKHNPYYSNGFYGYTSEDVNTMIAHQFIDLSKDTTQITILKNKKTCHLGGSLWEPIFVGTIKNKSELKRILKQIGYEN